MVLRRTWEIELRETGEHYAFVQGHVLSRLGTCGFQNSRETFKTNYMEPYSGISIPSMHPKPTARTVKEMRPTESPFRPSHRANLDRRAPDRPSGLASAPERVDRDTQVRMDHPVPRGPGVDRKGSRRGALEPCRHGVSQSDVSGAKHWTKVQAAPVVHEDWIII